MNRKTLLYIGGAIIAIIVVGAILAISYLQSLIAPKPLEITYATVQTTLPENPSCAGEDSEEASAIAKEILNLESDIIYVAGGEDAMPDDTWADYRFRLPILKNSTRNLLFNTEDSCFFRSPGVSTACEGDECFIVEEIVGHTWLALTTVAGQECYPDASGCSGDEVEAGYVSINTIAKCHLVIFDGPVIYELADDKGNKFVMHATETGIPDLTGPTLPEGWTLTERTIDEPLELLPFGGGDECYYNVVRDNMVQSYHQYVYAGEQYPE